MSAYGLRHKNTRLWLMGTHGLIFCVPTEAAAEAQRAQLTTLDPGDWEAARFVSEAYQRQIEQWKLEGKCQRCGAQIPVLNVEDCAIQDCPINILSGLPE